MDVSGAVEQIKSDGLQLTSDGLQPTSEENKYVAVPKSRFFSSWPFDIPGFRSLSGLQKGHELEKQVLCLEPRCLTIKTKVSSDMDIRAVDISGGSKAMFILGVQSSVYIPESLEHNRIIVMCVFGAVCTRYAAHRECISRTYYILSCHSVS